MQKSCDTGQCWFIFRDLQSRALPSAQVPEGYTLRGWWDGAEVVWLQIVKKAFEDFVKDWTAETFVSRYKNQNNFFKDGFFMVKHKDTFVATCFSWQDKRDSSNGQLHWLAVLPEHQGKGIGKWLAVEVLKFFKSKGKTAVSLKAEVTNKKAIRFYKAIGFEKEEL
ncbi:predicted protein [Nematostella vectensis]|uniref:N-acetyltransferase domain-containing protein n=1 Tax=Nematostella vectensis TaxID=45351 RepID=A7SEG0_NEMVE|nr:predicted protein [Nematostella vectensis]|eukprot:XP_001629981.1 predicted protein [Nematostella vectensis]